MAYSTTNLYPEDLNGTNPLNLIKNEVHTLQVPQNPKDFYFIIPYAAPFFVDSLRVFNNATGDEYYEGDDFLVGHRFIEAMDSIGRPIAGSIRFMRFDIIGQVRLEYRTIGGNWGFSDAAILRELSHKTYNPLVRSWGDIDVLPYSFPPLIHDQPLNELVGSPELHASLERIADILEASAAGATQNHLNDFNNPHRVTKEQVKLGNVPNFKMADDTESTECLRSDLFANPRGVLLAIQEHALKPLNAHINARGNVHGMVPADIGLGNVPNFPAATPAQAIDPTNNNTLLTPYTASLLVQKLQNDPRLDQLIIDFQNHITAYNPHNVTPAMIGTYTAAEIDQKIAAGGGGGGGGNALPFGGETPDQWEAKFPAVDDINTMLEGIGDQYQDRNGEMSSVDMASPLTPEVIAEENSRKIAWAFGAYAAYGIYNSLNQCHIVASSETKVGANQFPEATFANGQNHWASDKDANYYIDSIGAIHYWGANVVPVPAAYRSGAGFVPANASAGIWASKDYFWTMLQSNNSLHRFNRAGAKTVEIAADVALAYVGNGMVDPRPIGIAEVGMDDPVITPFGDASWKTAFNAAKATWAPKKFLDCRIGTEYLNVILFTGEAPTVDPNDPTNSTPDTREYSLKIYKINFGASITLTDVTNTIDIRNHSDGTITKANLVTGTTQVAGSYTHFVFTKPRPGSTLSDLLSYGDNSQGQLEMLPTSAPFLSIAAGYQYTITINRKNFVEFWGNSTDNSMFYRGGAYIDAASTIT